MEQQRLKQQQEQQRLLKQQQEQEKQRLQQERLLKQKQEQEKLLKQQKEQEQLRLEQQQLQQQQQRQYQMSYSSPENSNKSLPVSLSIESLSGNTVSRSLQKKVQFIDCPKVQRLKSNFKYIFSHSERLLI